MPADTPNPLAYIKETMAFPPQFLDDVRDRLTLSEIVGRRVPLKRKGREWTACCPFHQEKTPSFFVNDEKSFYHCFGCGKHGDHIGFLMESDGLSFLEAVKELADQAGLKMPEMRPEDAEKAEARKSLSEIMELVTKFYEVSLRAPAGQGARSYLENRGIRAETVKKFRLGFAPQGELIPAMAQRGVEVAALVELGLLRQYEDRPNPVEVFRDRLMFPITDRQGKVVAFGGRLLGPGEPKYLNSPETQLFAKGRLLYGLAQARRAALDAKEVIVAEGYMDVLALSQAGLSQAVAPLGTAVTEDQLRLLWKLVPTPTFALDGDRAGRAAAMRAVDRALPLLQPGLSLKFTWLPDGEDPDSLLKSRGLGALTPLLDGAAPLSDLLWQQHFEPPPETPEARAGAWKTLLKDLERLSDDTLRATFAADYEARFEATFGVRQIAQTTVPRRDYSRSWPPKRKPYQAAMQDASRDLSSHTVLRSAEGALLTLMLAQPQIALDAIGDPGEYQLSDPAANALFQQLFVCAVRLPTLDRDGVTTHVRDAGLGATLAQFDTKSMRTIAGITDTELSEQEFSAKVMDIWGTLTAPAKRAKPRLR